MVFANIYVCCLIWFRFSNEIWFIQIIVISFFYDFQSGCYKGIQITLSIFLYSRRTFHIHLMCISFVVGLQKSFLFVLSLINFPFYREAIHLLTCTLYVIFLSFPTVSYFSVFNKFFIPSFNMQVLVFSSFCYHVGNVICYRCFPPFNLSL